MAAHPSSTPAISQANALSQTLSLVRDDARKLEITLSSANLTTVIGPASEAGQMSEGQATNYLGGDATIKSLLNDNPNADAILARLGQLGADLTTHVGDIVSKKAQELVQSQIADRANDETANMVGVACDALHQGKLLTQSAVCLATEVRAERTLAQLKYASEMERINDDIIAANKIDTAITKIDDEIKGTSMNGAGPLLDKAKDINLLSGLKKSLETQKEDIFNGLIAHMDGRDERHFIKKKTISVSSKKDLEIPKNLKNGGGQQFMDNLMEHLQDQGAEYYGIKPGAARIGNDINDELGTHWQPPCLNNDYSDVAAESRDVVRNHSKKLYKYLCSRLDKDMQLLLTRTNNYGKDDKFTFKGMEDDGLSAIFTLSQLRPQGAIYRKNLEKVFTEASEHFADGHPRTKIEHLERKLKEAAKLGFKLQWTKTGREIAKVMSRVDHGYSSSLQDWKNGKNVSDPENCSADLDKMFCDIKIACSEIEDGDKSKDSKQWRSHWADARTPTGKRWENDSNYTNDKNGKMCDYGAKCQRSDCWFSHPKGWSGGEWKVSANTTMKRKVYMAYEKINDGGKGGKSGKGGKGGG